jgi:NAD(P)-dependent dehydrogenase (short-subunit alcohol dehydrogenase family)
MKLKDKVCLVTGGGSGIGKSTAIRMAAEGARVAVLSRTTDEIDDTVRQIRRAGGEAIALCADVSRREDMERAYAELVKAFGSLDVVFANAGINGVWAPIEELALEEWNKTISVNLTGTFLTLKLAVPHLKNRGGSIIINSSVNGTRVFSNSGATAYSATKAAQVAIAKMTALELAPHKIRVNVICPGAITTRIEESTEKRHLEQVGTPVEFPEGQHPLAGKPGSADQIAAAVVFLASDDADHITGTEMWIDGGESLIGPRG